MLITGCFNTAQFNRSLLWHVYLTIAAAFGVSTAMENTGALACLCRSFMCADDEKLKNIISNDVNF